jgi:hypothetical protein
MSILSMLSSAGSLSLSLSLSQSVSQSVYFIHIYIYNIYIYNIIICIVILLLLIKIIENDKQNGRHDQRMTTDTSVCVAKVLPMCS